MVGPIFALSVPLYTPDVEMDCAATGAEVNDSATCPSETRPDVDMTAEEVPVTETTKAVESEAGVVVGQADAPTGMPVSPGKSAEAEMTASPEASSSAQSTPNCSSAPQASTEVPIKSSRDVPEPSSAPGPRVVSDSDTPKPDGREIVAQPHAGAHLVATPPAGTSHQSPVSAQDDRAPEQPVASSEADAGAKKAVDHVTLAHTAVDVGKIGANAPPLPPAAPPKLTKGSEASARPVGTLQDGQVTSQDPVVAAWLQWMSKGLTWQHLQDYADLEPSNLRYMGNNEDVEVHEIYSAASLMFRIAYRGLNRHDYVQRMVKVSDPKTQLLGRSISYPPSQDDGERPAKTERIELYWDGRMFIRTRPSLRAFPAAQRPRITLLPSTGHANKARGNRHPKITIHSQPGNPGLSFTDTPSRSITSSPPTPASMSDGGSQLPSVPHSGRHVPQSAGISGQIILDAYAILEPYLSQLG